MIDYGRPEGIPSDKKIAQKLGIPTTEKKLKEWQESIEFDVFQWNMNRTIERGRSAK